MRNPRKSPVEIASVPNAGTMDDLAVRIERAYALRRPGLRQLAWAHPRVWSAAAALLAELNGTDPTIPADPELFVAAQPATAEADPWCELIGEAPARRYRRRVRQIVRRLRAELRGEVALAESRLALGLPARAVSRREVGSSPPLARLIVAHRLGQPELGTPWKPKAAEQHRSCPLYRQACLGLLPELDYPGTLPSALPARPPGRRAQFSEN